MRGVGMGRGCRTGRTHPGGSASTPHRISLRLAGWRLPPHRISLRLAARLLRLPLKGGNCRACVDVLVGKVAGIGWPPLRISLRLPARLLRLPLKGGVISRLA